MTGFEWTEQREEAAVLVAEDRLSNEEIAAKVGVTRQCVDKWKRQPEFAARVESLVEDFREAVRGKGIAERENRVEALNDRWHRMQAILDARAEECKDVPGGESGLLVKQVRTVKVLVGRSDGEKHGRADEEARRHGERETSGLGGGELASGRRVVEVAEYAVDVALLRELREHEKQAAIELGQWAEKQEHSGEMLVREYVGVDVEQV